MSGSRLPAPAQRPVDADAVKNWLSRLLPAIRKAVMPKRFPPPPEQTLGTLQALALTAASLAHSARHAGQPVDLGRPPREVLDRAGRVVALLLDVPVFSGPDADPFPRPDPEPQEEPAESPALKLHNHDDEAHDEQP